MIPIPINKKVFKSPDQNVNNTPKEPQHTIEMIHLSHLHILAQNTIIPIFSIHRKSFDFFIRVLEDKD